MVRMYKAGTAYVDVVPVFKDFQRLVAKHLKESLANKDNYKDLEGNLQRSLDKGLDNLDEKLQKQLKEAGLRVVPEGEKIGQKVGQGVNKGVAKELNKDNALKREIRKFGQDIEKDLGSGFMKGAYNSKAAREEIISNLKKISNAYTKEGAKSADEIERSYTRIRKAMESVTKTGTGKGLASKSDLATIEDALRKFEDNQLRIGKGYSRARIAQVKAEADARQKALDDQIKAEKDAAKAKQDAIDAQIKADQEATKAAQAEADEKRRIAEQAEEARKKLVDRSFTSKQRAVERERRLVEMDQNALRRLADADHEAALADEARYARERIRVQREADNEAYRQARLSGLRQSQLIAQQARDQAKLRGDAAYDRTFATARNEWRQIGADTARGNSKQQRLMESRRQTVLAAQRDMNSLLATMSKISSARPTVNLQTSEAKRHLAALNEDLDKAFLKVAEPKRIELHTAVAERSLERLRMAAEDADNIDWEIDINDERAKVAIDDIKRRLADIKDADIDVNVDVDRADLARTVKNINDSLKYIKDVNVEVDEKDALSDIAVINSALEALRDKRIGVDIDEKDAVANISAIRTAMASLQDKEVEIDIDRDGRLTDALARFDQGVRMANRRARSLADSIASAGVSMNESTQAFRIFNPMVAGLALVGAPAVSAIGSLTAGLGGLVSMAPGLIGGMGTIVAAFGGLEDAMKKYDKATEALDIAKAGGKLSKAQEEAIEKWEAEKDALGEATVAWIEYTRELKTSITEIQKGAREGLFPGLQRSIETLLGQYAGPMTDFLNRMGRGLGFVAEQWSNELVGDQAQAWFSRVADDAVLYTLNMAEAGANLVRGFAGLTDAFRPFAQELSRYLIDATGRFDDWANGLAGNTRLESFLNSIRSVSPEIGDLMKNIGEFFVNATIAVEPFSLAVLDALNGALDFVNALDPKVLGAILGAVGGLTAGMMVLSGVVAGAGALAAVLGAALSNPFTMAVTAVGSFIAISSTALGVTTAMSSAGGTLGEVMGNLGGALQNASDFTKDLWGAFGHLFDEVIVPLMPVLSQIVGDFIDLGVAVGEGVLINGLNLAAEVLGVMVDMFTAMPLGMQESILLFGGLALAAKPVTGLFQSITTSGFYAMQGLADRLAAGGRNMGALAASAGNLPGPLSKIAGGATAVGNSLTGASKGAGALSTGFSRLEKASGILTIVSLAVAGLGYAFKKASEDSGPMYEEVSELQGALEQLGGSAEGARQTMDRVFQDKEGNALASMDSQAQGVSALDDALRSLKPATEEAGSALDAYGAQGQLIADAASEKKVSDQIKQLDEALGDMVGSGNFESAAQSFESFAQSASELGYSQEEILAFFPGYKEQLEETAAALGLANDKSINYYEWMKGNVPPSVEAAVEAQGRQKDGLKGVENKTRDAEQATKDLIAANDELSGRFLSQEEANVAYYEATDKFNEHVKSATRTMDIQTEAGRRNREEFSRVADATKRKADADLEATGDSEAYTNTIWKQRKRLAELAEKFGMTEEEAGEYANTLLEIPKDVDTKAELQDYASKKARGIKDELDNIDRQIDVKVVLTKEDPFGIWKDGAGPKGPGPWKDGYKPYQGYHGGLVEFYANGGLRARGGLTPMDSIAQMVQPNTWRVVGDRGDVPEAYIPLNGSERSWKIMLEALRMMPGAIPFHDGGIAAFAAGAVTQPVAGSPSTPAADAGQAAGDTAIAEAMAALVAALGESWATMLTTMQTQTEAFYAKLLETMAAQNALALTAEQTHFSVMLAATSQYHAQALAANASHNSAIASANASHNSALSSANSSWRSGQLDATSSFMASMLSRTESGDRSIRNEWTSHWSLMSGITSDYRSRESDRMSNFLNGTLLGQISSFGRSADRLWSGIWNGLVDSARSIFSELPDSIGNILSSISGKMNTHIVTPYNKVVSDMDLSKKLKLNPFPTQKYADGGVMSGYTPGRDVHKFFSPTGGILELSGGEPVLRPEAGLVLGTDWVDGVNAAARTQGVSGVKKFLGGHQAHADGGFIESQAFANGGRIKKNHAGLIQLGRLLQSLGVSVTEHPAFGGVTPGAHSPTGWHPKNGALDLNAGSGTSRAEQAVFDKMIPILWKMGWGVIWRWQNHYNHAHVDLGNTALGSFSRNPDTSSDLWKQLLAMKVGPPTGGGGSADFFDLPGEMDTWLENAKKAIGTGALPDLMMGVGNKVFSALADAKSTEFMETASFAGADFSSVANGPIKKMAKAMLEKMGWGAQFGDLDWLLTRESGWRPTAQNPTSTAYGLFQFLNSTWDDVGGRKTSDPRKQLEYGLRYIQQRYGDVRGARAFWQRNHWYKDGTSGIDLSPNPKSNPNGTEGLVAPAEVDLDLSPDTIFRDGGGPLPTGYTTVLNNLGHEETILPATPHEVTKSFERLIETGTGDGGVTITDSVFRGDPREVAREVHREGRIQRIGRTVKF